jgi:methyltransferase (TIGR00027 family)
MDPGRASATAERAALLRAAHPLLDDPTILDDPVVRRLIDPQQRTALAGDLSAFERPDLRRLRASIAIRSRYAEDCLRDAVQRGVRQYVVLGAGLDSFALRNPFVAEPLRVFEVDHPDTQACKRERLRAADLACPASLTFVPVDFEREALPDALPRAGFDPRQPAFVSWLGVTMYLTRDAVLGTLGYVASLAPGSEIVFNYVRSPATLVEPSRSAVEAMGARAAAAGEPWLTFFEPAALAAALAQLGFAPVEDVGPEEAFERYCRGRRDGLRPGSASHLVRAIVPG